MADHVFGNARRSFLTMVGSGIVGAAVMLAFVAGTSFVRAGDATEIRACVNNASGTIQIVEDGTECQANSSLLVWNQQGPAGTPGEPGEPGEPGQPGEPGEPGEFSGLFTSLNGEYSIAVTDDGIILQGPDTSIELNNGQLNLSGFGVHLEADGSLNATAQLGVALQAATTLTLQGAIQTNASGSTVTLNGSCEPVARRGDSTAGTEFAHTIVTGSGTVFSC